MVSVGLRQCLDHIWGCLADVWGSLHYIDHKQLNRSRYIKLLPFLPQPKRAKFWGVCEVSGGCLEGVWVTLDTVWYAGYPIKIIFGHNTQILHCIFSDL